MSKNQIFSLLLFIGLVHCFAISMVMSGLATKTWSENTDNIQDKLDPFTIAYVEFGFSTISVIFAVVVVGYLIQDPLSKYFKSQNKEDVS